MAIPTEPVGSVPRSPELQAAMRGFAKASITAEAMDEQFDRAVADTVARFEATGAPIVTDGEQTKSSFATYPLEGLASLSPDGVVIHFDDGHSRQLPVITEGRQRRKFFRANSVYAKHRSARGDLCAVA